MLVKIDGEGVANITKMLLFLQLNFWEAPTAKTLWDNIYYSLFNFFAGGCSRYKFKLAILHFSLQQHKHQTFTRFLKKLCRGMWCKNYKE